MRGLAGWIRTWSPCGSTGFPAWAAALFVIVVLGLFCRISGKIVPKRRSLEAWTRGVCGERGPDLGDDPTGAGSGRTTGYRERRPVDQRGRVAPAAVTANQTASQRQPHRLDFMASALEHDPSIAEGLGYVRREYRDLLPASLLDGPEPASYV
jgi:hypothetical protein